jgi:membrane glycosyltransferase
LRTPEESDPPSVLSRARALQRELAADMGRSDDAVACLLHDPALLDAHRRMLPPARRPRLDPIDATLLTGLTKLHEAETLAGALSALTPTERSAVLADAHGLDRLVDLAPRQS